MPFFKIFNLLIKIFLCYYPRCIYMDTTHDKISRDKAAFAVRDRAISEIKSNYPGSKLFFCFLKVDVKSKQNFTGCDHHLFSDAFGMLCRKIVANLALHNQRRVDGRAFDQVMFITIRKLLITFTCQESS